MAQTIIPVDVISLCNAKGEIRPLRFRIEDNNHQLLSVDIDEVISSKDILYAGIEAKIFFCRALVNEKKWLFELRYTIRSHNWCFLRRIC